MGEIRNSQTILSGKPHGKTAHGRSKGKWKVQNKILDWFASVYYPIGDA
jgi:hypothetical protein